MPFFVRIYARYRFLCVCVRWFVCVYPQRVKELSQEVREFVAIENAKVLPLSARTGHGLDDLRASLAAALSRTPPPSQRPLCVETLEHPRLDAAEPEKPSPLEMGDGEVGVPAALTGDETELFETAEGVHGEEIAVMEAPEGAATATVLDYTSSAKTGKMLVRADMSPPPSLCPKLSSFFVCFVCCCCCCLCPWCIPICCRCFSA